MIKNIFIILIILILNSCSFDTRSGIWTEEPINLGNEEDKEIKVLLMAAIREWMASRRDEDASDNLRRIRIALRESRHMRAAAFHVALRLLVAVLRLLEGVPRRSP